LGEGEDRVGRFERFCDAHVRVGFVDVLLGDPDGVGQGAAGEVRVSGLPVPPRADDLEHGALTCCGPVLQDRVADGQESSAGSEPVVFGLEDGCASIVACRATMRSASSGVMLEGSAELATNQ
jgi:hypothetical protein